MNMRKANKCKRDLLSKTQSNYKNINRSNIHQKYTYNNSNKSKNIQLPGINQEVNMAYDRVKSSKFYTSNQNKDVANKSNYI